MGGVGRSQKNLRKGSKKELENRLQTHSQQKVICEKWLGEWAVELRKEGIQVFMKFVSWQLKMVACTSNFPNPHHFSNTKHVLHSFVSFVSLWNHFVGKCYTFSFVPQILHFPFLTPHPHSFKNFFCFSIWVISTGIFSCLLILSWLQSVYWRANQRYNSCRYTFFLFLAFPFNSLFEFPSLTYFTHLFCTLFPFH